MGEGQKSADEDMGVTTRSSLRRVLVPLLRLEYDEYPPTQTSVSAPASTMPSSFKPHNSPFNASKVALLIESRALPILAPLLLHFISVVPPDWRFRFMGSPQSVELVNSSHAVRSQVESGKLDLGLIPSNLSTDGQEMISRFLTNLWLYQTVVCIEKKKIAINIPITTVDVLTDQVRVDGSEPEDVWLTERLGHRPGARMANGSLSLTFSGEINPGQNVQAHKPEVADPSSCTSPPFPSATSKEKGDGEEYYIEGVDDWRDGFYEPMGYHTGGSGTMLFGGIWGNPRLRQHIWDYCPEVKMTLAMDAAKYIPGDCNANWKRDTGHANGGSMGIEDLGTVVSE
ncbi:hypothetical protein GQX73_g9307 [Xylaria multiplex]|uniref:Uncharacterized protein n=1 Tax=Xylaria multiplex TaxID=323545 RepID=A0A7C8MYY5_9PEZI|nr:hypothetical protein GQX73_g9307 [Xylaria multiplex]